MTVDTITYGSPHPVPDALAAQQLAEAFQAVPTPTVFELHRAGDPSGVSGPGRITTGVIWPGGAVVQRWSTPRPPAGYPVKVRQLDEYDSIAEVMGVHGHQGATRIVLLDPSAAGTGGCGDPARPEVFAVTDPRGDVRGWGAWWADNDRTAVYRPPATAIEGVEQVSRVATYRTLRDSVNDLPAPTGTPGQYRFVWLTATTGSRLVDRVRNAYRARRAAADMRRLALAAPLIDRDTLLAQLRPH